MKGKVFRVVRDEYNTRLPKESLDYLGLKKGDYYVITPKDGALEIKRFSGEVPA